MCVDCKFSVGYSSSSSDDIEELHYSEERRKVPPVTANSHLYCHASTLHIPSEALYANMDPKTQKYATIVRQRQQSCLF